MPLTRTIVQAPTLVGPMPWIPAFQLLSPHLGVSSRRLLNNSSGGGGVAGGPGGSDDGPPDVNTLPLTLDPSTGLSAFRLHP